MSVYDQCLYGEIKTARSKLKKKIYFFAIFEHFYTFGSSKIYSIHLDHQKFKHGSDEINFV